MNWYGWGYSFRCYIYPIRKHSVSYKVKLVPFQPGYSNKIIYGNNDGFHGGFMNGK